MSADTLPQGPVPPGRLRIYLGYAPGAGTTCALLSEGHQRAAHGTDVVVAIAETRGPPHTAGLLPGLEVIPRAKTPHHGTAAEEMDLDAVLARRPAVALVDDLTCSNGRGAGHTRRWQDAGELHAAGIDVIATVGVGQLKSLNDVVEKITGVPRRETVPDPVVRPAGEVELVDVVPQALRDRMAHGHIYPAERAEAALDGAFRMGNLSALRELALLWLADKLASDPQRYRPSARARGDSHAREPVVVALGGGPEGETLIRRAARIAGRSEGELLAVHAARPGGPVAAGRAALAAQRQLTVLLGSTYHQLADPDIPAALLALAQAENATQLVLGATRRTRLAALRPATTIRSQLIRRGGGIGVHIVPCPLTANGVPRRRLLRISGPDKRRRTVTQQQTSRLGRLRLATRWGRLRLATRWGRRRATPGAGRHPSRLSWLAPAVLLAAALTAAACGSSGAGGSGSTPSHAAAPASGSTLRTTTINGVTVLTTAKGFTLYSFAPDTPTTSKCNGSCAHFWPPVKGPATAGPGVTGKLSTIKRSDGSTQATYNSHPLYTYLGDNAPGQAKGNNLNIAGGIWHEVTASGTAAPAPPNGGAGSSGAGGYGY